MLLVSWRACVLLCAVFCLLVPVGAAQGSMITIGTPGNPLADWGITLGDGNTSNFGGLSPGISQIGSLPGFQFVYTLEDHGDNGGGVGPIGPNNGGQNYDSEFLGAGVNNGRLVVAIATGQRPDNAFAQYSPGDIRIFTSTATYGVEVGGGSGGPSGDAIVEGAPGSTYTLNEIGRTKGWISSDGATYGDIDDPVNILGGGTALPTTEYDQVAGSIWLNPRWILDPVVDPLASVQMQFNGGTRLNDLADYYYSRSSITKQHSIIELAIPLAAITHGNITRIEWSPSASNDTISVDIPPAMLLISTPEPTSLLLTSLGAVGWIGCRFRRRSKSATASSHA